MFLDAQKHFFAPRVHVCTRTANGETATRYIYLTFFSRATFLLRAAKPVLRCANTPSSACYAKPQFRPQVLRCCLAIDKGCRGDEPSLLPLRKSPAKHLFLEMGINVPSEGSSSGRQQEDLIICTREPVREVLSADAVTDPALTSHPGPARTWSHPIWRQTHT